MAAVRLAREASHPADCPVPWPMKASNASSAASVAKENTAVVGENPAANADGGTSKAGPPLNMTLAATASAASSGVGRDGGAVAVAVAVTVAVTAGLLLLLLLVLLVLLVLPLLFLRRRRHLPPSTTLAVPGTVRCPAAI